MRYREKVQLNKIEKTLIFFRKIWYHQEDAKGQEG